LERPAAAAQRLDLGAGIAAVGGKILMLSSLRGAKRRSNPCLHG
jgi:hypothetical protein